MQVLVTFQYFSQIMCNAITWTHNHGIITEFACTFLSFQSIHLSLFPLGSFMECQLQTITLEKEKEILFHNIFIAFYNTLSNFTTETLWKATLLLSLPFWSSQEAEDYDSCKNDKIIGLQNIGYSEKTKKSRNVCL